jgi:sigma-70-like protein
MSTPDTLAPDQRAVLELVLLQGRSYGELSELLAIPERDVRARADAGLRALAGAPAAGVDSGRIADWLLGQQPEAEAERTKNAVARNPAANEWAARAAERVRMMGATTIPDVAARTSNGAAPAAPSKRSSPQPTAGLRSPESVPALRSPGPATASKPRSSKLGGAAIIGVLAVVVAVGLVLLFTSGDDDEPAPAAQPAPTEQPADGTTGQTEATGNDIVLAGRGNNAQGLMRLLPGDDGSVQFAIAAQNVPPNRGREVYAVWFTRENGDARRLGFAQTQVGEEGVLTTGGPQRGDEDRFPRWFASYDKVLITRETDANARRPGRTVLEGTLPAGEG